VAVPALQWPRGRRRRTHDQTARPEVPLAASPSPRPCRTAEPSEHPSLCRGAFANSPAGLEGARTISALPRRPRPRVAVAPLPTQVPSTDRPRARAIGAADGRGQDGVTRMDRADHCRSRRPPSATAIDRAATPLANTAPPPAGRPRRKCPCAADGTALGHAEHGTGCGLVVYWRWPIVDGGAFACGKHSINGWRREAPGSEPHHSVTHARPPRRPNVGFVIGTRTVS
jgi:hypothetical protein